MKRFIKSSLNFSNIPEGFELNFCKTPSNSFSYRKNRLTKKDIQNIGDRFVLIYENEDNDDQFVEFYVNGFKVKELKLYWSTNYNYAYDNEWRIERFLRGDDIALNFNSSGVDEDDEWDSYFD